MPGDPVLRTMVGLVDCGEVWGLEVAMNVAGQSLSGTLISAADYAAEADDALAGYNMTHDTRFLIRQILLLAAPEERDEDPYGYKSANFVHLRHPGLAAVGDVRQQIWRGPIESVDAWSIPR